MSSGNARHNILASYVDFTYANKTMGSVETTGTSEKSPSNITKRRAETAVGPLILIGVLAKRTRCNIETIRFYEKAGVLPKPARTEGGHRVYSPAHVARLTFIRRTRELGFTLAEVRSLLHLVDESDRPCHEVKAIADTHLVAVKGKIADLRAMKTVLKDLVAKCDTGNELNCPLIEALLHD